MRRPRLLSDTPRAPLSPTSWPRTAPDRMSMAGALSSAPLRLDHRRKSQGILEGEAPFVIVEKAMGIEPLPGPVLEVSRPDFERPRIILPAIGAIGTMQPHIGKRRR